MVVQMTKKLKSQNGASLAIALVFLMMCSMAGAVILSAAGTASGRNVGWKKRQQEEYTLSSAGRVLLSELENQEYSVTTNYFGPGTPAFTEEPTGKLSGLLTEAADTVREQRKQAIENGEELTPDKYPGFTKTLTIAVPEVPELSNVEATFSMDTGYSIMIILKLKESMDTSYTVSIPASHDVHKDNGLSWEGTTYDREIFKVSWGEGQLKKNR